MNFADIKQDTPHLVVMFRVGPDGGEQFQWGVVGKFRVMSAIGHIARVQSELINLSHEARDCPQLAFVMTLGEEFDWWVHRDIPVDPLVGMLETIKAAFVGGTHAQRSASDRVILGPDGRPFNLR